MMFSKKSLRDVFIFVNILALNFLLLACSISSNMLPVHVTPPNHKDNYRVSITKDIAYGPNLDESLDLCKPVGASSSQPGIIMIHGGGWSTGDKSQYDSWCRLYATEGFVVTTINYRLAPKYRWPDQIGDVQLAVRYMRVNALSSGLDPTRICALGDSSGAELALLLDELQTIHQADVANIHSSISAKVQCVVDQFGPTLLAQLYYENPPVRQVISEFLDNQVPPNPIYKDASPIDQLVLQAGSALIIQGTNDHTVLPDQSMELYHAFQNANIPVQYLSYNGGHGYTGISQQTQITTIAKQINTFLISIEHP